MRGFGERFYGELIATQTPPPWPHSPPIRRDGSSSSSSPSAHRPAHLEALTIPPLPLRLLSLIVLGVFGLESRVVLNRSRLFGCVTVYSRLWPALSFSWRLYTPTSVSFSFSFTPTPPTQGGSEGAQECRLEVVAIFIDVVFMGFWVDRERGACLPCLIKSANRIDDISEEHQCLSLANGRSKILCDDSFEHLSRIR
jgi:hypothetical protein